ncbi:MAG TPA: inositol monophosphatase [Bryobacteraceae bacterium]|nr:inositol monophosphatase [Bryobacteraceae bacterium]
MQFERELEFARDIAARAGALALEYQARGLDAESKSDLSPVTIADRESERLLAQAITEMFPEDGLLGEEGATRSAQSGRTWIVDPIDGTRDFVRGHNQLWAVLLGLEQDREVVAGVAHFPGRGETYSASKGGGAWCNGVRLHASQIARADQAVLCLNGINALGQRPFGPRLLEWASQFWSVRSMGGAVDAILLASGRADVWVENTAQAWDLAPLKILFDEAGVRFRNFDGGQSIYGGNCVAYTPALEAVVEDLLQGQPVAAQVR